MNASPSRPDGVEPDRFVAAWAQVNGWRGHCLSHFTRVERSVSEGLLALARSDPAVPLPHLAGQRLAALETVLAGRIGEADAALFERFRCHDALRAFLAHGVADIALDRAGRWYALFELVALRHGREERTYLTVPQRDAEAIRRMVQADAQRLDAAIVRTTRPPGGASVPPALRIGAALYATG